MCWVEKHLVTSFHWIWVICIDNAYIILENQSYTIIIYTVAVRIIIPVGSINICILRASIIKDCVESLLLHYFYVFVSVTTPV